MGAADLIMSQGVVPAKSKFTILQHDICYFLFLESSLKSNIWGWKTRSGYKSLSKIGQKIKNSIFLKNK